MYLSNICILKTMSSNQYLNSKVTPQSLFQFSPFPYYLQWETCLSLSLLYLFIHSVPQKVTNSPSNHLHCQSSCRCSLQHPQPLLLQSLHRYPTHTEAWAPIFMHGCCCHSLCLPPGCSQSPCSRSPWPMVGLTSSTHTQAASFSLLGSDAPCQAICPLHPLKHKLSPKSRRTSTSQF